DLRTEVRRARRHDRKGGDRNRCEPRDRSGRRPCLHRSNPLRYRHDPDDRRRPAHRHPALPSEGWPTMTASSSPNIRSRVRGLRANALAAVVMMLIQYSLGISVNLYSTLPASDHGKSLFPGFAAAVGKGPALVTLHALLGTFLLITASVAL